MLWFAVLEFVFSLILLSQKETYGLSCPYVSITGRLFQSAFNFLFLFCFQLFLLNIVSNL